MAGMKIESAKKFFKRYSVFQQRKTTINHAFASALAGKGDWNPESLALALREDFKQDPEKDLRCVYCDAPAATWDHLIGLVRNGQPHGPGHQVGNLVPCCTSCNQRKGGKDWTVFIPLVFEDVDIRKIKESRISAYQRRATTIAMLGDAEIKQLDTIKEQIFALMKQADDIVTAAHDRTANQPSDRTLQPAPVIRSGLT